MGSEKVNEVEIDLETLYVSPEHNGSAVAVRVHSKFKNLLENIARKYGISLSMVIKIIIAKFLELHGEELYKFIKEGLLDKSLAKARKQTIKIRY